MKSWLIAFVGTVTCVVSLGLLSAPAGALTNSTTTVTDNAAGVVTGGTFTFTATVTGSSGTPTGSLTWAVTGPSDGELRPLDPRHRWNGHVHGRRCLRGHLHGYGYLRRRPHYLQRQLRLGHHRHCGQGRPGQITELDLDGRHLGLHRHHRWPRWHSGGQRGVERSACSSTPLSAGVATCSIDAQASTSYSVTASHRQRRQLHRLLQRRPGLARRGQPSDPDRHLHPARTHGTHTDHERGIRQPASSTA